VRVADVASGRRLAKETLDEPAVGAPLRLEDLQRPAMPQQVFDL
jgi:hypothetical protein